MKQKLFGILLAALVVSAAPTLAAERNHDAWGSDLQGQVLCYGGCYGDGNYGYCGRGYRGGYGQNQQ